MIIDMQKKVVKEMRKKTEAYSASSRGPNCSEEAYDWPIISARQGGVS